MRTIAGSRPPDLDVDPAWPAPLRLLLGPEAGELLAAVAEASGGRLGSWHPRQVTHQPGAATTVQYRAEVASPDGTTTATFVASTGASVPEGVARFDDGTDRIAVWRWPSDPFLPGLTAALDPGSVGALFDRIGLEGSRLQLRVRAYRPGRRAVVEACGGQTRLFLKVVPPARVADLHARHRSLAGVLPVPMSLGWTDEGVVVLQALPGMTLREALRTPGARTPAPSEVTALLDRLPVSLLERPARRDLVAAARHHARVVAATVPSTGDRLDELLGRLDARGAVAHPVVPVHGDLYEAQILLTDGRITGLLDVDTAGSGHRIDDLANACAHLSVLALVSDRPATVRRYGAALLAHAEASHDRWDLRRRVAAAVIGLATGPFRVLEPDWERRTHHRLDLAAAWLDDGPSMSAG
jgi:aminoglycoside phosphotransferase